VTTGSYPASDWLTENASSNTADNGTERYRANIISPLD
jgi:hypothetical protein